MDGCGIAVIQKSKNRSLRLQEAEQIEQLKIGKRPVHLAPTSMEQSKSLFTFSILMSEHLSYNQDLHDDILHCAAAIWKGNWMTPLMCRCMSVTELVFGCIMVKVSSIITMNWDD